MKRLLSLALVLTFVLSLPLGGVAIADDRASLPQLEDEVMCPICGTLLGLSRAPAAERQRVFIRGMIADGASEQEIKDALVAEYGPQVLALPDDEGINLWAYVVPVLIFALAAIAVLVAVIKWRRNRKEEPPAGTPAAGPSGPEADRLDQDMARYDL